jgi:hypothetical protein
MMFSNRIEIYLDDEKLNRGFPPFIVDVWTKVLKEDIKKLGYRRFIQFNEYRIKKFQNKEARDKCNQLLKESLNQ